MNPASLSDDLRGVMFGGSRGHKYSNGHWVKRHGLSLVLAALFLAQMAGFHFTRLPEWVGDQQAHGDPTALWPDYWLHYWSEWFASVLADTYGALILVLLTKWFYEQGSNESSSD